MSRDRENRVGATEGPAMPDALRVALERSPNAAGKLARLVEALGGGDPGLGLDGLVGLASAVLSERALGATPCWTRTLAATQSYGMSDADTLDAFRIDGAQLPRLRRWRTALRDGSGDDDLEGFVAGDVEDAEWLLRMMCVRSDLRAQVAAHADRVTARRREAARARASAASTLPIAAAVVPAAEGTGHWPMAPVTRDRHLDA